MVLRPASELTLEELTDIYNRTRTDYLIPMPMNPGRLQEYMTVYDIDLHRSCIAFLEESVVGLGMLGLRAKASWVTRLGVLPEGRRKGIGSAILVNLIDYSKAEGAEKIWLEVIKGNDPAHELFIKFGFSPLRELIVARRPPRALKRMSSIMAARKIHYLQHEEVIDLHCARPGRVNWLNEVASMRNVRRLANTLVEDDQGIGPLHEIPHLSGIWVEFQNGSEGWISYQATTLQLKRIWVEVLRGDPAQVTSDLIGIMHRLHGSQDAVVENIPEDEQWPGYLQAGYFEVFRRIEMVLEL